MPTEIVETCPLCSTPTKDGRLNCECDSGCGICSETLGARESGLNPHFGCQCECHYPLARVLAEREAGGPLCGECGMRLYDGRCLSEGSCSRYYPVDYDDDPSAPYSYMDAPLRELEHLRSEIHLMIADDSRAELWLDSTPF